MAIKLHGHPLSPPAKRALLTLAEKGLHYDFIFVDLAAGEHKKDTFISINPFGQVPVFEDGDLKLFESRAITRYIAQAYADEGTPLISADPKKNGIIAVWLEVESLRFDAAAQMLGVEILLKPLKGMTTDETAVEQLQAQLAAVLDVYEARLAQSKYLAGDDYSLADLHHIPIIDTLSKTKVKALFDARPHVATWAAELLGRPAWQKVKAALA